MSDGLSQLAQRGRRTRAIPPPRNPARTGPVQLTSVPDPSATPAEPAAIERKAAELAERPPKPSPRPAPKAKAREDLKVVTIYLEQEDDDFLETITHTGRTSQPKTAISRSAVVRLALERLGAQMKPAEIVDELRPRGNSSGTGRKRR